MINRKAEEKPKGKSKYALKFQRRVHLANKIGTDAFYRMTRTDGKECRNLPHSIVILNRWVVEKEQ